MGKPKIDLSYPCVTSAIEAYMQQARAAVEISAAKDDAVRPVYALNARTNQVAHEGSCVLLAVADQVFALSASHVLDAVGQYALLIGCGTQLHELAGDRFSTARGRSGTHRDDPIDASVFHIRTEPPQVVRESALSLADLDMTSANRALEFYVAAGYRVSKSKSTENGHTTELERLPTMELDDHHYQHWRLRRDSHLLVAAEDQALLDLKWQTSPSIRGFSGGAMFRVDGLGPVLRFKNTNVPRVKLAAILTERRKGQRDKFHSAAVGTRLGVHFGLIHKYLPKLRLDEMLAEEYERQVQQ